MIITIPFKTPTINHLYWHRGNMKIMTKEAKEVKEHITKLVDLIHNDLPTEKKLKVTVEVRENWLTKKGEVKRKDVANREKFIIDCVFDALGIDDKFIYELILRKVQSEDVESAIIKIEEHPYENNI